MEFSNLSCGIFQHALSLSCTRSRSAASTFVRDRWEGYAAQRTELLAFIQTQRIPNVIFLAADLHASLITAVSLDPIAKPDPIATEVVVGPIANEPLYEALSATAVFSLTF